MEGLISGAECALPSNPLAQVLKHTDGDRSLQQDRIAGPSSSRLLHLPGTTSNIANEQDMAMARRFFEGNTSAPGPSHAFAPGQMAAAEFARMREMSTLSPGVDLSEAWAREQGQRLNGFDVEKAQAVWASEFRVNSAPAGVVGPSGQQSTQPNQSMLPSYASSPVQYANSMSLGMYGMGSMYGGSAMPQYNLSVDQGKGKGKSRDIDFEAAFAQVAASFPPVQTETARIVEVDSSTTELEDVFEKTTLNEQNENAGEAYDFKKVWDNLQNSDLPPPAEDMEKWEAEFQEMMSGQREEAEHDYGTFMQEAWENGYSDVYDRRASINKPLQFDDAGLPILGEYTFESSNKYLDPSTSTRSSLAEAKALLEQNGSLSEAAILLEAAIQKGDLGEGGYEAWILLGETRNMDEREDLGMRALIEGVRRAEAADGKGAGMLSLAISYTNESYDRASHVMLLRWLMARFPDLPIPDAAMRAVESNATWDSHEKVTDVFLNLARQQHSKGIVDPDVQIGLGVLFYTNQEYEHAKDCFESALSARPNDYLLWNRLGSSLSNGNNPEEALGAYREALRLRPTYTRAIYNVGVACLNIGAHKEAAEHFLSALTLQESTGGETSEQLWSTLRRVFISMDRRDLADLATDKGVGRPNLDVFRREGLDF